MRIDEDMYVTVQYICADRNHVKIDGDMYVAVSYLCVDRNNLVVDDTPEYVRHGDIVQLIHGISSQALNR